MQSECTPDQLRRQIKAETDTGKRIEETITATVEEQLSALQEDLQLEHDKEIAMSRLEGIYKSHYRTKYGHMKPHDPNAVLGDSWDVHPNVAPELHTPEKDEPDPCDTPGTPGSSPGGVKRSKKEPVPPEPAELASVDSEILKSHLEIMEARVRWLNQVIAMLPLKVENREARKSLTAERMDTEDVVSAYRQVLECIQQEGLESVCTRLAEMTELIGPGNVVFLAEHCPLAPGTPTQATQRQQEWEKVLQQRPQWNTHLWGDSLRYWKGVKAGH